MSEDVKYEYEERLRKAEDADLQYQVEKLTKRLEVKQKFLDRTEPLIAEQAAEIGRLRDTIQGLRQTVDALKQDPRDARSEARYG